MLGYDKRQASKSSITPDLLKHMHGFRGATPEGQRMTEQSENVLAARMAELAAEVRELRQMLAPLSAVILTGAEVAEHFRRLRNG